ncbi:oligoendopeptidase F-like protein PepF [Gottschalkia purinilytica]|uniref:Oligoendopeptidase F-like protein PepF n=1 Tax=Gottschalkia purinilytica TaxID=1503 RepID=A0A0L0W9C3_GOTPU|nr:M3 family oligoendopeptidase [Gottschalkia purinilytica]KNF07915.1 oligoendopeptidase F-like protein PepF [Gottschalkia purinilytica]
MNMRWSLDDLYNSFDSKEFNNDLILCDKKLKEIKLWTENNLESEDNAAKKIEEYITLQIDFYNVFTKLITFANLTTTVEARNEIALKTLEKLQVKYTELTKPSVSFQKWLGCIGNLESIISSSKLLEEHRFYLKELSRNARYLLSEEEEDIVSKMSNTGSKAWAKLQDMITSTLLIDININGENKQLPLPIIRNMAYDKNPNIRKKAYESELESYKKIEESSCACLNGIKGEVITLCNLKGYSSPLEETLLNSRMSKETLDSMFQAIKESLPIFHKYYKRKSKILGHKNGLPFYDIFAPIGDVNIKFTYNEARNYIVKNFRTFSDKLADYADNAFENNWIDAEPREGKRGGAFCSNIHAIKQSRILANFNGSFSNMITLAHELGHGYHGSCLVNESILNSSYPMPIAETASIFCETIVMNAALKEVKEKEALSILESSISNAGQVIVDIYSRFLFESEVFKRRKDSALTVSELKEIMINSQKEAYGDSLDSSYLHPYMWINKSHYYSASRSFYNFPYAFGLLFSKGIYSEYLKRGNDFVKDYDKLLAETGKNNIVDVAKMMGFDINSLDFWRSSLKQIEMDINKFLDLSK